MTLNRFASDYLRKVKAFSQQRITKVKVKINIEKKRSLQFNCEYKNQQNAPHKTRR